MGTLELTLAKGLFKFQILTKPPFPKKGKFKELGKMEINFPVKRPSFLRILKEELVNLQKLGKELKRPKVNWNLNYPN